MLDENRIAIKKMARFQRLAFECGYLFIFPAIEVIPYPNFRWVQFQFITDSHFESTDCRRARLDHREGHMQARGSEDLQTDAVQLYLDATTQEADSSPPQCGASTIPSLQKFPGLYAHDNEVLTLTNPLPQHSHIIGLQQHAVVNGSRPHSLVRRSVNESAKTRAKAIDPSEPSHIPIQIQQAIIVSSMRSNTRKLAILHFA
mmetsp:Transcript_125137/g.196097  ORF Transcript_125137/g.196097 Transcript_125137/m.196097 type:complete len:202 (-) Transcript_125137:441-1046(-)